MYSSFLHATHTQQLIYGKYLMKEEVLLHNRNLKSEIHKLKQLVTILMYKGNKQTQTLCSPDKETLKIYQL